MLPSGAPDGPSARRKESKKSKSRDKLSRHTHSLGFDRHSSIQLCPEETSYSLPSMQQSSGITSNVPQLSAGLPLFSESSDSSMADCSYNTSEVDGWGGGVGRLTLTENLEYTGATSHLEEEERQRATENYGSKRKKKSQFRALKDKLERLTREVTDLKVQKRSTEASIRFMEEEIHRAQCIGEL